MINCFAVLSVLEVTFTEEHYSEIDGLEVKYRNVHSDRKKSDTGWFHIYGNYGKSLYDTKVIKPGDKLTISFEEKKIQIVDKSTGKQTWKTVWDNIKVIDSTTPQQSNSATTATSASSGGLDTETF